MKAAAGGNRLIRVAGILAALIPALALIPAAMLDRGPAGNLRATGLYVALTLWDPYTWLALGHSLGIAAAVALGSMVLGVALAGSVERSRFWGRSPLAALSRLSMAVPPLCGAIGLRTYLGAEDGRWLTMLWVDLAAAVPWVARDVAIALRGIDPAWVESAALAGATRWRMRRELVWPLIRPAAARSAATMYVLALIEPGAPLVLGLRRTLAFQLVEAASRSGESHRAASLALLATLVAATGRALLLRWGRREVLRPADARFSSAPNVRALPALRRLAFLLIWNAFALAPLVGLVMAAASLGFAPAGHIRASFGTFSTLIGDAETARILANSLLAGALAATLAVFLARVAGHTPLGSVPPLATAVGVVLLPGILSTTLGPHRVAADTTPSSRLLMLLMAWALATAALPLCSRLGVRRRPPEHRPLRDAALALGASRGAARRLAAGPTLAPRSVLVWLVVGALAATDTAVPLLFIRNRGSLSAGPGVLRRLGEPDGLPRAAALACLIIVCNGLVLGLVGWLSRRHRPPMNLHESDARMARPRVGTVARIPENSPS